MSAVEKPASKLDILQSVVICICSFLQVTLLFSVFMFRSYPYDPTYRFLFLAGCLGGVLRILLPRTYKNDPLLPLTLVAAACCVLMLVAWY